MDTAFLAKGNIYSKLADLHGRNQQIIFSYLTCLHEFNQQTYDWFPVRVQQQTCMKVGFCHKAREQWMGLSYP
ncbi:hypothetical protein DPMN_022044 [Dreissena polymorpha]|uniref:Uncharacterized protein n=1 Tax=Dreissena polymorpha TaxID=45954 RepID=A0A9D4NN75_DREPO|nr:hypothetical protein DPMN_022044 [Dreissena polymorpha]